MAFVECRLTLDLFSCNSLATSCWDSHGKSPKISNRFNVHQTGGRSIFPIIKLGHQYINFRQNNADRQDIIKY